MLFPLKPTDAQKRALGEIAGDLERGVPMNRLLQGDVGSGKTIVAFEAATIVIENGYQAALMAPTEILGRAAFIWRRGKYSRRERHYRVELLISGMKTAEKKAALERLRSGEAQLVVGTHAYLLEPQVEFKRLGLVIVDEQHRFWRAATQGPDGKRSSAGCAGDDRDADPAHAFAHALW